MIKLEVGEFSQTDWNKVVSDYSDLSMIQTWEYGQAKAQNSSWKAHRGVFTDDGNAVAAVQVMVREIPGLKRGLAWINRGPLWHRSQNQDDILQGLLEQIRQFWAIKHNLYVRVALPLQAQETPSQEALKSLDYQRARCLGWSSMRLDISVPEEVLRKGLQQKWRNCLHKSERLDLKLQMGSDGALLRDFLFDYKHMIEERKLSTGMTPEFLESMQNLLPADQKMVVLRCFYQDKAVASVLLARYGQVAEYFAGVVGKEGRAVNAGHLLLWRGVCAMKAMGHRWFDLGGADPNLTPDGIMHFKMGLGGAPYRLAEEIETYRKDLMTRFVRWRVCRVRKETASV